VVFTQVIHLLFQRHNACCRQNTRLAHPAADHLAALAGQADELFRAA
jgi:hypothetical protein